MQEGGAGDMAGVVPLHRQVRIGRAHDGTLLSCLTFHVALLQPTVTRHPGRPGRPNGDRLRPSPALVLPVRRQHPRR